MSISSKNEASIAQLVEDVQGDDRWMSLVSRPRLLYYCTSSSTFNNHLFFFILYL